MRLWPRIGTRRRRRWREGLPAALVLSFSLTIAGFFTLDAVFPPDMSRYEALSVQVMDRDGAPLRFYLSEDGYFRLPTAPDQVDRRYLQMLIAYEDKRFHSHPGIDPLALGRAVGQWIHHGRIVSGASTLTMQAARLLEPRPRTVTAKLIEMFRALQLERRYSKDRILSIYLTLAPFGGNVEGVRAASWRYFGRRADDMTLGEGALLVALPQSPTSLRPDQFPDEARTARNGVIERLAERAALDPGEAARTQADPLAIAARPLPMLAPHFADHIRTHSPGKQRIETTIDGDLQTRLEALAARYAEGLEDQAGLAILVVDHHKRDVLAWIGSPDLFDEQRAGAIDMVRRVRSPGSALKPVIYGMAFDRGIAHPKTIVDDVPTAFGDYAPSNFMDRHYGQVTLAQALALSLNVPAVSVLEKIGPVSVTERLRRDGIGLQFGAPDAKPGLALALGGVGITLEDLVRIYAALAHDGRLRNLTLIPEDRPGREAIEPLIDERARAQIAAILDRARSANRLIPSRLRSTETGVALKTGTSYGFRDAWAIGYNARFTVGVWTGRPDGAPSPGRFGANTAAPLVFQVFDTLPPAGPAAGAEARALIAEAKGTASAPGLKYLDRETGLRLETDPGAPRITWPFDEGEIVLPDAQAPVTLEAEGGTRPLHWFVNGRPLPGADWSRRVAWRPDGRGFHRIVVVDGNGRRDEVDIRLRTVDEVAAAR